MTVSCKNICYSTVLTQWIISWEDKLKSQGIGGNGVWPMIVMAFSVKTTVVRGRGVGGAIILTYRPRLMCTLFFFCLFVFFVKPKIDTATSCLCIYVSLEVCAEWPLGKALHIAGYISLSYPWQQQRWGGGWGGGGKKRGRRGRDK